MVQENIVEQLKSVRSQLRMSQEDLARELGVSFATVNRWENGRSVPSRMALRAWQLFCSSRLKPAKTK